MRRITEQGRLHQYGNLVWFYDDLILRTLKLRKYLTSDVISPDAIFFRTVITDKIKVKTYLTDRVLTGDHKPIGKKDGKRTLVQFILLNVAFAWELNMLSLRKFALSKVFLKQQSISYDRLTYCLKSFPLLYVLSLGMPSPTGFSNRTA